MWRKQMAYTNAEGVTGVGILEQQVKSGNEPNRARNPIVSGPVIGELQALTDGGNPLVLLPDIGRKVILSESTIALTPPDIGRRVLVVFEQNNSERPIVIGMLGSQKEASGVEPLTAQVTIDGSSLSLRAERELTLRCGEASITLTRAGKVIIRGKALLSRSSGVNRIKGACVQIN